MRASATWLFLLAWLLVPQLSAEERRPNIVLLLADDLGYGETGMQGNREIATPHIDSLVRRGVRCTAGYVTASYCSPSRAGLLTGRHQSRFGYEANPTGERNLDPRLGLPLEESTLGDRLSAAGYATGLVGKWHLGGTEAHHPQRRGFQEFWGFLHEGRFFVPPPYEGVFTMLRRRELPEGAVGRWTRDDGRLILTDHMRSNEPKYDDHNPILRGTEPVEEAEYLTRAITREACAFLERNRERPFFLYVGYNAVHSPLQATAEDLERVAHLKDMHRRIFGGMLVSLDDGIGALLAKLRELELERDTLVVFLSDHGGPTRELTSSNHPLRGGKGEVYEGGLRVPFVLQWPGRLPEGKVYSEPVSALDLVPTALAAAGLPLPEPGVLDGVDLLPFLTGARPGAPHAELYWRMLGRGGAMRAGDWKLVTPEHAAAEPRWELYNLADDPGETTDLAPREPATRDRLLARWRAWAAALPEPVRPR